MAEVQKTEYVSARFRTLSGQERTLIFPRDATLSQMQKELCWAFSKYYPCVEVGLILNDKTLFQDMIDRPLLHIAEGTAIEVIFTQQTDMRHIDRCFRGRPSFEEDMQEPGGQ